MTAPTQNGHANGDAEQGGNGNPRVVLENVASIAKIEQQQQRAGWLDRAAEQLVRAGGSMPCLILHVIWFAGWIILNIRPMGLEPFDAFPFSFLTMIVSLEAIFLAMFVLRSEASQSDAQDRRAQMDLQINVLAEQEITKLIRLVSEIHGETVRAGHRDPEVEEMSRTTPLEAVAAAVDEVS